MLLRKGLHNLMVISEEDPKVSARENMLLYTEDIFKRYSVMKNICAMTVTTF